jgi:hypothetical protein
MLTEVKAYSSWASAPVLPLSDTGRTETDLIQIRNIDGLDPVKAAVSTAPFGAIDGVAYTGSNILSRNILMTLHPNPNWDNWTYESLRRLLYSYFMPKRPTRLAFYSDDIPPVHITGIVEDISGTPFVKDPELVVSVICPDPYFTAIDPTVLTGFSDRDASSPVEIDYNGTIEAGIHVEVSRSEDPAPSNIGIQIGDPSVQYFNVAAQVNSALYFEMNSLPRQKYVQNVDTSSGIVTNLLSKIQEGSSWPVLEPGVNEFSVITDAGLQDWELTYYERFGGL